MDSVTGTSSCHRSSHRTAPAAHSPDGLALFNKTRADYKQFEKGTKKDQLSNGKIEYLCKLKYPKDTNLSIYFIVNAPIIE